MPALDSLTLNPDTDDLRPVADLMKRLTGRRPSPATIWRWCKRGTSRAGVLPSVSIFGQRYTSKRTLVEWLRRGSEAAPEPDADENQSEATDRRLKSAGLL